jgi:integrase
MTNQIVPQSPDQPTALQLAGQAANHAASHYVFEAHRAEKSANTLRAQDSDLCRFSDFLHSVNVPHADNLNLNPDGWRGITWGLIEGFKQWLLGQGYAVGTVNRALATVRKYAALAFKAGVIDQTEHALIRQVAGIPAKAAVKVDAKRDTTRKGWKKAEPTELTDSQAERLKHEHEDTPTGRRDALLMCLLINHALRVGEAAALQVGDVNLEAGKITFTRPKTGDTQTDRLFPDDIAAMRRWLAIRGTQPGALLLPVTKGGRVVHDTENGKLKGMTENALRKRVRRLGDAIGIDHLSPHDNRHYWTTYQIDHIQELPRGMEDIRTGGGWKSYAMIQHYIQKRSIANEGTLAPGVGGV